MSNTPGTDALKSNQDKSGGMGNMPGMGSMNMGGGCTHGTHGNMGNMGGGTQPNQ